MDPVVIIYKEKPELKNPVLIEGLPGVGNVGKLAADHLVDELKAVKFAEVYSRHFPPQVMVSEEGIIRLVNNELYYWKADHSKGDDRHDIVFLCGDYQGLTPEGQYELADLIFNDMMELGVSRVYTLGGYGLGRMVEEIRVLGAATTSELVKEMTDVGVIFSSGEPGSGIVGASGLLMGMAQLNDIEGVCLMGETSGYFVDPKSARSVLEILTAILDLDVSFAQLEEKAVQIESIANQLRDLEMAQREVPGQGKQQDLNYIG